MNNVPFLEFIKDVSWVDFLILAIRLPYFIWVSRLSVALNACCRQIGFLTQDFGLPSHGSSTRGT